MIIVFDFDHTIFNMSAMHEDLLKAMTELGVSERVYQDAYNQVTNWKMFTPQALAQRLQRSAGISATEALNDLNEVAKASGRHVYPDASAGFEALTSAGHELYILCWGDRDWQMKKIEQSGLVPFCKGVFLVSQLKADHLKTMLDRPLVLVDDKPAELKAVQDRDLGIRLIRMRRPNGKYSDQEGLAGVPEATNMAEVIDLIKRLGD
ncbi:MAG: HAD hydrolase-like protein [Parcubacteria group bacterium]|nr:HAD hydrolase-like protein [Parcubacteria group bacterium]